MISDQTVSTGQKQEIQLKASSVTTVDEIEEIKNCQEQIRRKTDALKTELARRLAAVCQLFDFLCEVGQREVLREPQYFEYTAKLSTALASVPKPPKQCIPRGEVNQAMKLVLEGSNGGLRESELRMEVKKLLGREIAPLHSALKRMCEANAAVKKGDRFSLTGKFKQT